MESRSAILLGWLAVAGPFAVVDAIAQPMNQAAPTSDRMAEAARTLLASLDGDQKRVALLELEAEARERFHYVPEFDRAGLPLEAMQPHQVHLAHALLSASLSRTGYSKTVNVMALEAALGRLEAAAGREEAIERRNPSRYYFAVFGEPGADAWGWRIEGHHVSLHFTVVGEEAVATTPAFLGSNPHRVPEGPHEGLRILGDEEDRARALLRSLDDDQRARAVVAETPPRDIFTSNRPRVTPEEPQGIAWGALDEQQRQLLRELLGVYVGNLPDDLAERRRATLGDELESLHFAWMGSVEPGGPHYYRVQGRSFVVEYDNVQGGANHSHTVWRDFEGDFGRDLLTEHHRRHRH